MPFDIVVTGVQLATTEGPVKARVDIRIDLDPGSIRIFGFSVIQSSGKPAWVGFPQKSGKNGKKYFPVLDFEGRLKELVTNAILDAFEQLRKAA